MIVPCFPFFKCFFPFFNKNKPLPSYYMIGPVAVTIMFIIAIIVIIIIIIINVNVIII